MEFCSGKAVAGGDVRETHEGLHQGKLAGVIEAQSRNALSRRSDGRFGEPSQLATVNEGLQDILLDGEIVIVDCRERVPERRQVLDRFVHAIVVDVIARGLGPEDQMIANVLLDEAAAVVAADHRIGQVHVFDLGLQLAPMTLADPATEDHGDLVGLSDCSIGIKQPLPKVVQRCTAMKDQVVAEFDLRETTTDAGNPLVCALSQ